MPEPQSSILVVQKQTPNTYLTRGYFGKKKAGAKTMKKQKKGSKKDKEEEWDTGFGELMENIQERKKTKLFPEMNDLMKGR